MKTNRGVSLASVMVIATLGWSEYGWWSPDGEFFGEGNFYAEVTRQAQDTKHDYRVSVFHRENGNYGIKVELIFRRPTTFSIATKEGIESLEVAYMEIVAAIADFEQSNRFMDEIWTGIVAAQNRRHIFKQQQDGSVEWVASTYEPYSFGLDDLVIGKRQLGQGKFFVLQTSKAKHAEPGEMEWRTYEIHDAFFVSKPDSELPLTICSRLEQEVCVG